MCNEYAKITSYVYAPPSHRILFRGSLSVPDSWLLLEGLSFILPINHARSPSDKLLQNPLAIALESMRRRTLATGIVRDQQSQFRPLGEDDRGGRRCSSMFIPPHLSTVSTLSTSSN
ncbi:hypothetical protein BC826DRAFT_291004 [Russula brevipes]|nr:hypothetical protein BC826DRAFT_291004 [Russula brevipes]